MVENHISLLTGKIDGGTYNSGMDFMQVFNQVQAGAAMDMWQVKTDMGLLFIAETDEQAGDFFIFQEGKFILPGSLAQALARIIIEVVIITKAMVV